MINPHSIISTTALLVVSLMGVQAQAVEISKEPIVGQLAAEDDRWSPLEIVNVESFPWDSQPRFRVRTKTIFKGPTEGALIYCIFPPTWTTKMPPPGMPPHYHHFHEWG